MFVTFQYRGLNHLELYCSLIIEAGLKLCIQFDCRYLILLNTCILSFLFIVLNARDINEYKYPSIVFLSILSPIHSVGHFSYDMINSSPLL